MPNKNYPKNLFLKSIFPKLTIQIISSKKKIKFIKEFLVLKKAKYTYVMQLDDDVELDKNCLYDLYNFIKGKKKFQLHLDIQKKIIRQLFIKSQKIF